MSTPSEPAGISVHALGYKKRRTALDYQAIGYIAAALDFIFVLVASALGFITYERLAFGTYNDPSSYVGMGLVTATIFVLAMSSGHAYRPESILELRRQVLLICTFIPSALAFLLTVIFFLKLGATFSRGAVLNITLISMSGLIGLRYFWRLQLPVAISAGLFRTRKVMLICPEDFSIDQLRSKAASSGVTITHVMRLGADSRLARDVSIDTLRRTNISDIDEVLIVWRDSRVAELEQYLAALRRFAFPVNVMFEGLVGGIVCGASQNVGGAMAFQTQGPPLSVLQRGAKRAFDIGFSLLALVTLAPILVLVSVAIKLDSNGPVLFVQSRRGYGNRPFRILKFRSMTVMENTGEIRQATRNDPRVTRVGAFIRAASIDELPQFWNVLMGEMSVVGPRPHAISHDDLYDTLISDYAFRRHVKPGLTGWAQVNGCRGETPTVEKMEERVLHDLWYINNWSFWLDLRIVLRTMGSMHDLSKAY
jgi:Undecaprenyl-phosphate glucose phosphotransferase